MSRKKKVLVVGSGGREHAICWRLERDETPLELHAAPGNPGVAQHAQCHAVQPTDLDAIVSLALHVAADLVIVGPEAPLAAGLADKLRAAGVSTFGPSAAAARIESSKSFAKALMLQHGIPTAYASRHTEVAEARSAVRRLSAPVVIKASGLAAGKGVFVCERIPEADAAIDAILRDRTLGESGSELLVEEFMEGEELSVFAVTDGHGFLLLPASQDHKRLGEGDTGPNTGGMGAYTPVSVATASLLDRVADEIIAPTLHAMRSQDTPFRGLLYAGLMLTSEGPRVVEFNCRFGDPETQVVLPTVSGPLFEVLLAASSTSQLDDGGALSWNGTCAVTTVVAAEGYPDRPRTGDPIGIPEVLPAQSAVFHAGTKRLPDGTLVTSGGRVLAVTGFGVSLEEAASTSRRLASSIEFAGRQFRRDIAWRELARGAASPG